MLRRMLTPAARARFRTVTLALLVLACTDQPRLTGPLAGGLAPSGPQFTIADAARGYKAGFYWRSPLVKQSAYAGAFDGTLSPTVEICRLEGGTCAGEALARFTMTAGPGTERVRLDAASEQYNVNWHTDEFELRSDRLYRISVRASDVLLGFADVQPVSSGRDLKNVNTGEYIALLDGRTLPIKFRIETGIVATIVVQPVEASPFAGATQQFTAVLTDLHGAPIQAPVVWASSNHDVATIEQNGLASTVAQGEAEITATAERVTGRAALTVLPDPRDMTIRTTLDAPGGRVEREHRAVAGEPTPLDVDGVPGADLTADIDYTQAGIALAVVGREGAAPAGLLTIEAARDAATGDERRILVQISSVPADFAIAFDFDAMRISGRVSTPVTQLFATIGGGTAQGMSALSAEASLQGALGSFEMSFHSGIQLVAAAGISQVDVRVHGTGGVFPILPVGEAGAVLRSDANGIQLAVRAFDVRQLNIALPLAVDAVMASGRPFSLDLTAGTAANVRIPVAPAVFTLGLSALDLTTDPRAALSWRANASTDQMMIDVDGVAGLRGGELTAEFAQLPTEFSLAVGVPAEHSTGPGRFQAVSNARAGELQLVAGASGRPRLTLHVTNMARVLNGCIAASNDCRPSDRVPSALRDYDLFGGNPAQSATAGGLNRPYPALLSVDFDDAGTTRSATSTLLTAALDYANGSPITITELRFHRFTLDFGLLPASPLLHFEGADRPRAYLYVDSDAQSYSLGQLTTPALVQSFRMGSASADRRLAWLPGPSCSTMLAGFCLVTELDRRAVGSHSCGSARQFFIRLFDVNYDLLTPVDGRPLLPICD